VRHLHVISSLVFCLGCSGSPGSSSGTNPAGDAERSLEQWIAALEQADSAQRAAVELRGFAAREDSQKAIEPLLRAWQRNSYMPDALQTAIALASDGRGGPYWPRIVPTLRSAVSDATVSDTRSLKSALLAVDALARVRDADSVPALITIIKRSAPDLAPGHRLRLAAIAALGRFGDSKDAVAALIQRLRIEPSHRVQVIPSAAALALGQTRSPDAVVPLLEAMIRIPSLFPVARRALVNIGQPAVPELIALLQARQKTLAAVARDLELTRDCAQEMGLGTGCSAPGLLRYRAAVLLGDFHARATVQPLVAALAQPAVPVFFDSAGPGPDDHQAVLEALARIGDASAAPAVWAYARDPANKPANRAVAMTAYGALVSEQSALPVLAEILEDENQAPELRRAAAFSYAQMARDRAALGPLLDRLARRLSKSEAKGADVDRTAQSNLARAQAGALCGADASCYISLVQRDPEQLLEPLGAHIPDLAEWPAEARLALAQAVRERALLELGKLGAGARPVLPALMEPSSSPGRALRKRALQAIVRIAELPCDQCVARLGQIIETERDDATHSWMVVETEIVRDYFSWAGR
jgi:hypothetical protein